MDEDTVMGGLKVKDRWVIEIDEPPETKIVDLPKRKLIRYKMMLKPTEAGKVFSAVKQIVLTENYKEKLR